MDLEEAKKRYSICVPTDEEFYSKEYKAYFEEGSQPSNVAPELEKYRQFQDMYNKSFLVTFGENVDQNMAKDSRIAVVLGGQAGAGKTGLVNLVKKEALLQSQHFYLIDDDQYRKFYPMYDDIMAKCPEYSTALTAIGSAPITPKILKYASDNGLNFIFDGTMKNTRIVETAKQWKDYDVRYKVMATSRLESLISVFERNAYLRVNGFGRPVSVDVHDETYNGIAGTVSTIESQENANIEIYMRGTSNNHLPELIYSPKQKGLYINALEALINGRIRDKRIVYFKRNP